MLANAAALAILAIFPSTCPPPTASVTPRCRSASGGMWLIFSRPRRLWVGGTRGFQRLLHHIQLFILAAATTIGHTVSRFPFIFLLRSFARRCNHTYGRGGHIGKLEQLLAHIAILRCAACRRVMQVPRARCAIKISREERCSTAGEFNLPNLKTDNAESR